ncbi:hypothetical protein CEXT_276951 [Caerostris extrusa]|uniref:Uncharacterized protein n=1 Tax=Caerostris extrusa TaxID=172846 RepID=A0AAV4QUS8_CAEEX|nr:hypothetical protein CEXT_276951 [Caerostris extrusa]
MIVIPAGLFVSYLSKSKGLFKGEMQSAKEICVEGGNAFEVKTAVVVKNALKRELLMGTLSWMTNDSYDWHNGCERYHKHLKETDTPMILTICLTTTSSVTIIKNDFYLVDSQYFYHS